MFVLIASNKLLEVLIQNGEMDVVLNEFQKSLSVNGLTEKNKNMAKLIISNMKTGKASARASALLTMFDCTFKWKNIEIWRELSECFGQDIGVQGENGLVQAFRVFTFDQTHPRYIIGLQLLLLTNIINNIIALKSVAQQTSAQQACIY